MVVLTDKVVRGLKTEKRRSEVMDQANPGFGVRVSSGGRKTFIYRFRYSGALKRMELGVYPGVSLMEARRLYQYAKERHQAGLNPGVQADTVADLASLYIERYAKPKKRSWETDRRMLERDVIPMIGKLKLEKVRKRDIVTIMDRIQDRGALTLADRTLEVVKRMFGFAVDRDLLEVNPAQAVKKLQKYKPRERILTEDEIAGLFELQDGQIKDILLLILYTAQRKGEVCKMKWNQIEDGVWHQPGWLAESEKPHGWVTKNEKPHDVPLTDRAMDIIKRQESDNEYVFSSHGESGHIREDSVNQHCLRLGEGWTPHDVRRSVATGLAKLKIPRVVIAKLLNHSDGSVTAIYDRHGYFDEMRVALETWCNALHNEPETAVILPMTRRS